MVFPAALFTAHGYRAEAGGPLVSPAGVGNSQGALKGDGQGRERGVVPSSGAQGGFDLVRRQGQHPEAMPILRRPVEPAESPARLQLREPSGAFLGTQELGEDVPDLALDLGAEWPGDFREGEREAVLGSVARGSPGFAQARRSNT